MRAASHTLEVERVVQTSSLAAVFYGRDDPASRVFTEADWTDPDPLRTTLPIPAVRRSPERAAWAELPKCRDH